MDVLYLAGGRVTGRYMGMYIGVYWYLLVLGGLVATCVCISQQRIVLQVLCPWAILVVLVTWHLVGGPPSGISVGGMFEMRVFDEG